MARLSAQDVHWWAAPSLGAPASTAAPKPIHRGVCTLAHVQEALLHMLLAQGLHAAAAQAMTTALALRFGPAPASHP